MHIYSSSLGGTEGVISSIFGVHKQDEATRCIATELMPTLIFVSCILVAYDFLTMLDKETEYIWRGSWSVPKVAFHLNRFLPAAVLVIVTPANFLPSLTITTCKTFVHLYSYGSVLVSLNIAAIVTLRCWALYDYNKWILKTLLFSLVCATTAPVVILNRQTDVNGYHLNHWDSVLYTYQSWLLYGIPLVFETLVFALTVYNSISVAKEFGTVSFMRRLMIDGTIYCLIAIFSVTFYLIAASIDLVRGPVISAGFLVALLSPMCSRMFLSLEVFAKQDHGIAEAIDLA